MKKGDIVRRLAKDGQPVGNYFVVSHCTRRCVYVERYAPEWSRKMTEMWLKEETYPVKVVSICISEDILMRILKCRQSALSSPITAQWKKVLKRNDWEVVNLYTKSSTGYLYAIENIRTGIEMREQRVRIVLSHRIML